MVSQDHFDDLLEKYTRHNFHEWYSEFASQMLAGKGAVNLLISTTSKVRFVENFNQNLFIAAEILDIRALITKEISLAKFNENLIIGIGGFTEVGAPISVGYFLLEANYHGGANQAARDFLGAVANANKIRSEISKEQGHL